MENMKLFIMIAREVDTSILCWTVGFMEGAHLAIARHHKNGIIHQKKTGKMMVNYKTLGKRS